MAKKALGKGLGALLTSSAAEEGAGGVQEVPVRHIRPNPYQPRKAMKAESVTELAESIRAHGVIQPLIVKQIGIDSYELVAGERRWRAAQEAGLRTVPVVVRDYENRQMLEVALIENLQREDIGPVEAATAYKRLGAEFGMTQSQIATRVGKAQSTIANCVRLLTLPPRIVTSLGKGEISEGHARALLQTPAKERIAALDRIKREELSVREAEALARGELAAKIPIAKNTRKGRRKSDKDGTLDPNLAAMEDELRTALGTKVSLKWNGEAGRLEIEFYSQEHLESVVEKLLSC